MISAYQLPTLETASQKFEQIIAKNESLGKNTVVFCEDRLALVAENLVCHAVGGSFLTSVYSPGRFLAVENANRTVQVLSNQGSAMIIRKLIEENRGKLKLFKKLSSAKSAQNVYDTIALLYSSRVSPDDLIAYATDNALLKEKVDDLALLYGEYTNYLQQNGLMDRNTYLRLLPEVIENSKKIKDAHVIFFGFQSFTCSVLECVRACMSTALSTCGIFVGGSADVYTNEAQTAFLGVANAFGGANFVKESGDLAPENKVFLQDVFNPETFAKTEKTPTDKIEIFSALNPEEEMAFVCAYIKKHVLGQGKRYRDITVMVPDVNAYAEIIERTFAQYDVPAYVDIKHKLSQSLIANFTLRYMDCLTDGCLPESVFAVVSSPLFNADERDKNLFVNYCLQYANYRGGAKRQPSEKIRAEIDFDAIERVRTAFVNGLSLLPTKATGRGYREAITKLVELFDCQKTLENLAKTFEDDYPVQAQFIEKSHKYFSATLLEAEKLTLSDELPAKEFNKILKSGFDAAEISLVPPKADAVFVADLSKTASVGTDVLFACGLTASVPSCSMDTAILTDRDLASLEQLNVIISPKISQVNTRTREMTALNIGAFRQKLYLSCPVNFGGEEGGESEIIKYVKQSFMRNSHANIVPLTYQQMLKDKEMIAYCCCQPLPAIKRLLTTNDYTFIWSSVYQVLKDNGFADGVDGAFIYDETKKKISTASALYVKKGHISPTTIESYFACPYRAFMEKGLGAQPRKESNFGTADAGNYVHAVMQEMGDYLAHVGKGILQVEKQNKFDEKFEKEFENKAREYATELINKLPYSTLLDTASGAYSAEQLVDGAVKVCKGLFKHVNVSRFNVSEVETVKYLPLTDDINVKCKIDRVDSCGDMVRVIDYKTGDKSFYPASYYMGTQLQPALYLLSASQGMRPVGAYYFGASTDYSTDGKKEFAMNGIMDGSPDVVESSDFTVALGEKSALIGEKYVADPTRAKLDSRKFKDLIDYSVMVSKQGVAELVGGNVTPSPTGKTCDYCAFGGSCNFRVGIDGEARESKSASLDKIIEIVNEERGDE